MSQPPNEEEQLFEISAVSRLTGVSTANIRVWEKRHQVVEPQRSASKRRRYNSKDIRRLTLLKTLIDRGDSIGTIAALTTEQLETRLEVEHGQNPASRTSLRLLIAGDTLRELVCSPGNEIAGTEIVASHDTLDQAEANRSDVCADTLLIECPTLFAGTIPRVQALIGRTQALRAIIIYHFAQSSTVDLIQRGLKNITAVRAPVNLGEIALVLSTDISLAKRAVPRKLSELPSPESEVAIPIRLYSDRQLAVASQISTAVDCECPQHLGNLLTSLTAFEAYCAACESNNPEDAALHHSLHETTAKARSLMEHALRDVAELEGIEL